jgi:hypothetical protein
MFRIKIDNKEIQVDEGTSVMKAAGQAGIKIPALCWHNELEHFTSCMVCLVKDARNGKLFPSCSVKATEGMEIITDDAEIREGRQTALELLLSEHVGDCEAPCQIACPAHMDIPRMNRLIAERRFDEALENVVRDIALPSVLGRICPAPCEGVCRRKTIDEAVSICLIKRFSGDEAADRIFAKLMVQPENGKKVAVIGSGPAGLAAAFYLRLRGYHTEIFEKKSEIGGILRTDYSGDKLPKDILDDEINRILGIGVGLKIDTEVDPLQFSKITKEFDVVVIASGLVGEEQKNWGLKMSSKGFEANDQTYETSQPGVFAIGNAFKPTKLVIRLVAQGKEVAFSVDQYLSGKPVKGEPHLFNSKFGKLVGDEFAEYLKEAVNTRRHYPSTTQSGGFTPEEVVTEAKRCLHCDCRKLDDCKLREFSDEYKANQRRFSFGERRLVTKQFNHDLVVYEPQKCIKCGICVRLTEKYGERFGFTFIGRGFDVVIGVPFSEELQSGLEKTAQLVVDGCPTGALSPLNPPKGDMEKAEN